MDVGAGLDRAVALVAELLVLVAEVLVVVAGLVARAVVTGGVVALVVAGVALERVVGSEAAALPKSSSSPAYSSSSSADSSSRSSPASSSAKSSLDAQSTLGGVVDVAADLLARGQAQGQQVVLERDDPADGLLAVLDAVVVGVAVDRVVARGVLASVVEAVAVGVLGTVAAPVAVGVLPGGFVRSRISLPLSTRSRSRSSSASPMPSRSVSATRGLVFERNSPRLVRPSLSRSALALGARLLLLPRVGEAVAVAVALAGRSAGGQREQRDDGEE